MDNLKDTIFFRPESASKATGISKSHIWTLINKGILPSFSPSPKIRLIRATDLIAYIENSKIEVKKNEN